MKEKRDYGKDGNNGTNRNFGMFHEKPRVGNSSQFTAEAQRTKRKRREKRKAIV